MNRLFYGALGVAIWAFPSSAQQDAIAFNGIELHPGMAKTEVIAKLQGQYRVQTVLPNDENNWCISEKNALSLDDPCSLGNMVFNNGRLRMISKKLGYLGGDRVADFLGHLFIAFSAGKKENDELAVIYTQEFEDTDHVRTREIRFHLANGTEYTIRISEPVGSLSGEESGAFLREYLFAEETK